MKHLKNFLIKREQSQARLRFAKCEKSRLLARTLLTLVALLALTTQAWADDAYEELTTADANFSQMEFTGQNIKITCEYVDKDGFIIGAGYTVKISALNGKIITKVEMPITYLHYWNTSSAIVSTPNGTIEGTYSLGQTLTLTLTDANASEVTLNSNSTNVGLQVKDWKVYYTDAPAPASVPLTWTEATKTATLTNGMPAGNVTVSVDYFAQAELAESGAPAPIPGVLANTDAPIVTPGTVANIGTSEVKQGTLMYYVSQTPMTDDQLQALTPNQWSDDVPTAADLLEGAAYVYYYIQGAEPATIAERTDANTCSDGDILAANVVNVTVLSNKFDLTLNPANVNTIDATQASKGTVTVKEGTGAAVDKTGDITADGKLKAVKMDSEVKLKANNGYKFRKVEVKKDKKTLTITGYQGFSTTLDIAGCTTWDEVITKNPGMIQKDDDGYILDSTGNYDLVKGDGENKVYVKAEHPFDPNATDYKWQGRI